MLIKSKQAKAFEKLFLDAGYNILNKKINMKPLTLFGEFSNNANKTMRSNMLSK